MAAELSSIRASIGLPTASLLAQQAQAFREAVYHSSPPVQNILYLHHSRLFRQTRVFLPQLMPLDRSVRVVLQIRSLPMKIFQLTLFSLLRFLSQEQSRTDLTKALKRYLQPLSQEKEQEV